MQLIYSYTRKQAIEDGVLVDVTPMAKEAGYTMPVALTMAVHAQCVKVPDGCLCQDESGRLWDILMVLKYAIKRTKEPCSEIQFIVLVQNDSKGPQEVYLKSLIGPGDNGEPVITVMFPAED